MANGNTPQPAQSQPGFLGKLASGAENTLSNPLVDAALGAYLGFVGSPRYEGMGAAIAHGGETGLGAFTQAEQLKRTLPLMTAQTQVAQLGAQQAAAGLRPLSSDEVRQLDQLKASATDPQERQFIGTIESQLRGNKLTTAEFDGFVEKWNESKRLADMMKAQAAMYGAQVAPQILHSIYPGLSLPPSPSMPATGTPPSSPSVPSTATASMPSPSPASGSGVGAAWMSYTSTGPAGHIGYDGTDGKWYVINPDGSKGTPVS